MSNTTSSSSGIGFTGLLTIVFITLKLTHFIDWSWWWVLCPLWIGVAILLLFVLFCLVVAFLTRPRTPEEKAAQAVRKYRDALLRRQGR